MRGARSLIVLLVVAAGLGAYIYFVEAKRDTTDPALKREKVFTVESGSIDEVTVRAADGDVTTLKKTGDDWQVTAPISASADSMAASSIVSTLETLEMNKNLGAPATALKDFGLDPPRYAVTFKAGGTAHTLNVGNKTPTGSDVYAAVDGQPSVFLMSSYLDDNLNRTTFDLRDKFVLKFTRDDVDAITLQRAGAPDVSVAKTGVTWQMRSPLEARVDPMTIDTLLSRAGTAQARSIVAGDAGAPSAADLRRYGLERPQFVLTVGAGSTRASLAIGGKAEDGRLYARDLSKPLVYTVDDTLLTELDKRPDDLRAKEIVSFNAYTALGLEITRGGKTWVYEKAKGAADANGSAPDVWKETRPEAKDANMTAMTDLLNTLASLKAERFVARPAAAGDDVVVVARSGDASKPTEERVTLRKTGDTAQALTAGASGAAVIPAADFDKIVSQLDALTGAQ